MLHRFDMTMCEDAPPRPPSRRAAPLFLALGAAALALLGAQPDAAAAPLRNAEHIAKHGKLCQMAARKAERRYRIPSQLLSAISLAESGRYSRAQKATFPWPWTVRSGPNSYHLPNRAAAVALVKRLQAKGVRNIDIGCMQINLGYHPKAFSNLRLAFNPAHNVDYAARFLTKLHKKKRSWALAVGHYHSGLRKKRVPYWRRVVKFWNSERRRAARERRGRIIAEYEERRRQRLAMQAQRRTRLQLQGLRPPRR
jgi:soluble lytic murein transglycosylase-like protein